MVPEWQIAETVPKDGSPFVAWFPDRPHYEVLVWRIRRRVSYEPVDGSDLYRKLVDESYGEFDCDAGGYFGRSPTFTYWALLPQPAVPDVAAKLDPPHGN
jgi:hypothetical protein